MCNFYLFISIDCDFPFCLFVKEKCFWKFLNFWGVKKGWAKGRDSFVHFKNSFKT